MHRIPLCDKVRERKLDKKIIIRAAKSKLLPNQAKNPELSTKDDDNST
jgi:hypothetical protein